MVLSVHSGLFPCSLPARAKNNSIIMVVIKNLVLSMMSYLLLTFNKYLQKLIYRLNA
jgi:hypothetical protein